MMNSPAVLFYTSDFLTGVMDLTMEERGQYITLLCYQHQKGHIKEETIRLLVGNASVNVLDKFIVDEKGLYFNERMDIEIRNRENFVDSRRENGKLGGRPKKASGKSKENLKVNHMGNLMGNDNDNENINGIIEYLNILLGTKYKTSTEKYRSSIKTRFKEGYTEEDFKIVIDKKYKEWKNTEFERYLNPETLFGNKFQKYLNQPEKKTTLKDIPLVGI